MAIDPSIPLEVKPAKLNDPVSSFLTLQHAMQANQLGQLQLQEAQQARQDKAAVREVLRQQAGADLESPEGRQTFLGALAPVAPEQAFALRRQFSQEDAQRAKAALETQKARLDAQKAQLGTYKETMGLLGDLMGSVKDQGTYDRALQIAEPLLRKHGFGLEGLPRQYDPAVVGQLGQMNRTSQQRVEEALQQLQIQSRENLARAQIYSTDTNARLQREATADQGRLQREQQGFLQQQQQQFQGDQQARQQEFQAGERRQQQDFTAQQQRWTQRQAQEAKRQESIARLDDERLKTAQEGAQNATTVLDTVGRMKELLAQGVREVGPVANIEQWGFEQLGSGPQAIGERTQRYRELGASLVTQMANLGRGITDEDRNYIEKSVGTLTRAKTVGAMNLAMNDIVKGANRAITRANTLMQARRQGEELPPFATKPVLTKADLAALLTRLPGANRQDVIQGLLEEGVHVEE